MPFEQFHYHKWEKESEPDVSNEEFEAAFEKRREKDEKKREPELVGDNSK